MTSSLGVHRRTSQNLPPPPAQRALASAAIAVGLTVTTACGSGPDGASSPATGTASGTGPIEVVYETNTKSSEGAYHAHGHLIASDPTHVRYSIRASGFAPMLFIYDGQRLLVHDAENAKPWSLYEAADEHPEAMAFLSGLFSDPHSAAFITSCPSASTVGHQTILGHTADGYHCAKRKYPDGSVDFAHVIWLDRTTNVLLRTGPTHATLINDHPAVDAETFSTKPPAGANVAVYRAQGRPGAGSELAPDFHLKRVGQAGTASLADYTDRPLVLAFFVSDLVFDPDGSSCPGCVDALLTLQRMTADGADPPMLAVQEGNMGKPGFPLIPKGLTVDVVNDPDQDLARAYGLSDQVGFAFITADHKVHETFNEVPTDEQLQVATDALH